MNVNIWNIYSELRMKDQIEERSSRLVRQPDRKSCPRLPHSVDSRFGLYHVAVVSSFLRSPISLAEICVIYLTTSEP